MRIEETILSNLMYAEGFTRKVLPFLKEEYFSEKPEAVILSELTSFFMKHDALPSKEILRIECQNRSDLSDKELSLTMEYIDSMEDRNTHKEWLISETEAFCKKKSIYNAIINSIKIIDGTGGNLKEEAIPKLLQDALSVSFDVSVGHSYFDDAGARFDSYSMEENGIPFDLNMFNKIYKNGLPNKTLTICAAQSGGGKSLLMSHVAAATLIQGKNVLYITLEMGENKIGERIDANLLKTDINAILSLGKEEFMSRVDHIHRKTMGRLFVKEYPPMSASAAHFRGLIEELKVKQGFIPELLVVDYLGICASSRLKMGGSVNTYTYMKSVAEELRGLGIEYNIPVLTGAQLNRGGFNNTDITETDIAESMGLVMTADMMFAMIRTEQLDSQNQVMIKQLKNRYGDLNYYRRFLVGIDRARMKLFDLEESAQDDVMREETPPLRTSVTRQIQAATRPATSGLSSLNF